MLFSNKEFIELSIKNKEYEKSINNIHESSRIEAEDKHKDSINNVYALRENKAKVEREFNKFVLDVKTTLLSECMYKLMDRACGYQSDKVQADVIKRNLVNNFIQEQGTETLLRSFRTETYMLSEFARLVNKYSSIIVEKADKNNTDSFMIDEEDKDNFFDELKMDDVDDVATAIRMRVSDSVDEFVNSNIRQKEELKETLIKSKEKIETSKNEEVKESYNILAKKAMTNIREKRRTNIFECMVYSLAEATMKNDNLKNIYAKENKLDMDSIVENCTIMYTFLETLNTAKIAKVNEAYITNVIKDLKK